MSKIVLPFWSTPERETCDSGHYIRESDFVLHYAEENLEIVLCCIQSVSDTCCLMLTWSQWCVVTPVGAQIKYGHNISQFIKLYGRGVWGTGAGRGSATGRWQWIRRPRRRNKTQGSPFMRPMSGYCTIPHQLGGFCLCCIQFYLKCVD